VTWGSVHGRLAPGRDVASLRATRAIIDLDAIEGNVTALRSVLLTATQIMAVVKADAYGHGLLCVAESVLAAGATSLGIATVDEGRLLRRHAIKAPVVLLGAIMPEEAEAACRLGLEITVADERLLEAVRAAARRELGDGLVSVHLKVDTGLRRYGAPLEHAAQLAQEIARDPYLRFAGLCTHFASADERDDRFTDIQWKRFQAASREIEDAGVTLPPRHVANSAGVLAGRSGDCEIARPGIAIYGVPPSDEIPILAGMRPALHVESRIARVIDLVPGDTVGYNRTFRAERHMRAALVPIGYADGYRRGLAGVAWMGLAGQKANVLGRISMDQTVVEVPRGVDVSPGDVVQILGGAGDCGAPSISQMAALMETNAYEVLVGLRKRIPRVYLRGGSVVAVRSMGLSVDEARETAG
jgi:alanine racemase